MQLLKCTFFLFNLERFSFILIFLFIFSFTYVDVVSLHFISLDFLNKILVNFFYFFKYFFLGYAVLFFSAIIFLIINIDTIEKKLVNGIYMQVKYLYYVIYALRTSFFSVISQLLKYITFFASNLTVSLVTKLISVIMRANNTFFIFWKPLFKRVSYFGLFRTSRARWIRTCSINVAKNKI